MNEKERQILGKYQNWCPYVNNVKNLNEPHPIPNHVYNSGCSSCSGCGCSGGDGGGGCQGCGW